MRYDDLEGKNILIMGASAGIGRATALYMNEQKANLFLVARRQERLEQIRQISKDTIKIYSYDLSDINNVKKVFDEIHGEGIKLDGMVYCAGIAYSIPLKVRDDQLFQKMMQINVNAFIESCKWFSNRRNSMQNSVITVVSSASTVRPEKGRIDYTVTKGAINSAVPIIAKENLSRGIRVNAVSPGFVNTELYEKEKQSFDVDEYIKEHQPLGLIEPESVAEVIAFLHSTAAKYITGQNIIMDAGSFVK